LFAIMITAAALWHDLDRSSACTSNARSLRQSVSRWSNKFVHIS